MNQGNHNPAKAVVLDHLDSYSLNVAQAVAAVGFEPIIWPVAPRPEKLRLSPALLSALGSCRAVVLSPGPGHPRDYDLEDLKAFLQNTRPTVPVLGVCLGLQTLLHWDGMEVVPLAGAGGPVVHGRVKPITRNGWELLPPFHNLQASWGMVFYNSLGIRWNDQATQNRHWFLAPSVDDDPYVTVAVHRYRPWAGVQFHPESFASREGSAVFQGFAEWCATVRGDHAQKGDHTWSAAFTQPPLLSSSCSDSCTSAIT